MPHRPTARRAPRPLTLGASTVLACALAACGGGNGDPPPQTGGNEVVAAAPVVTITNNVAAETATGAVTFTFSFNRDVGTSFTADDIAVTGGSKGAFSRTSGTSATLEVVPTADSSGTVVVSVAAGAVTDAVGTPNAAASASKAYNTVVPVVSTRLLSFDEATPPTLTGFGGAEDASIVADPTNAANKVAKVVKSASAELWAGTTLSICPGNALVRLPFSSTLTTLTARVWSPAAGVPVRIKVENAADAAQSVETEATTTVASGWQTLRFNFASPAAGTAALDTARTYDKLSVFFNFGTPGAATGARTYYLDDVAFEGSSFSVACAGSGGATTTTITMDEASAPTLTGFGGAEDASIVADPTNAANKVAKVVKSATAELWAGTTVSTAAGNSIARIGFSAGNTTVTARVWSPVAGIPVRMKVEDATDASKSVETEATVTTAAGWQTLSFNFANPVTGTAALNLATSYTRLSVFFDFGRTGAAVGAARTYYLDDIVLPRDGSSTGGTATPLRFATGFGTGNRTVEGGEYGGFSGSNLDGYNCNGDPANCGGGGEFTPAKAAADSYFFYYHQTPTPAADLYMGIYVQAPGVTGGFSPSADTAGVQVGSQTTLRFKLGQNNEWFGSGTNNFMVVMDLGKRYTVSGNACRLQLRRVVTPTAAAASDYAIPLASFALVQDCAGAVTSVAQALAASPISQIAFQGVGGGIALSDGTRTSGANRSVAGAGGLYPTTLVLQGGISID